MYSEVDPLLNWCGVTWFYLNGHVGLNTKTDNCSMGDILLSDIKLGYGVLSW